MESGVLGPVESESDLFRSHAMLMFVDFSLGVWMTAAPDVLRYGSPLADHDRVVGAMIVVVSVLALRESIEKVRWLNVPLGLSVMIAPFVLAGGTRDALVNGFITGLVVATYALIRVLPRTFRGLRRSN